MCQFSTFEKSFFLVEKCTWSFCLHYVAHQMYILPDFVCFLKMFKWINTFFELRNRSGYTRSGENRYLISCSSRKDNGNTLTCHWAILLHTLLLEVCLFHISRQKQIFIQLFSCLILNNFSGFARTGSVNFFQPALFCSLTRYQVCNFFYFVIYVSLDQS